MRMLAMRSSRRSVSGCQAKRGVRYARLGTEVLLTPRHSASARSACLQLAWNATAPRPPVVDDLPHQRIAGSVQVLQRDREAALGGVVEEVVRARLAIVRPEEVRGGA